MADNWHVCHTLHSFKFGFSLETCFNVLFQTLHDDKLCWVLVPHSYHFGWPQRNFKVTVASESGFLEKLLSSWVQSLYDWCIYGHMSMKVLWNDGISQMLFKQDLQFETLHDDKLRLALFTHSAHFCDLDPLRLQGSWGKRWYSSSFECEPAERLLLLLRKMTRAQG